MLFFNPGKKISGIPLIGDKIKFLIRTVAKLYDFLIDYDRLRWANLVISFL